MFSISFKGGSMAKDTEQMEYQRVMDYIYRMILDKQLIVGSKIPSERDIAETLGIGRNSTREAISMLRGMGVVESRHGSGNYISKDSGRSIWRIVSIMLALGSVSMKDIMEFRRVLAEAVLELVFRYGLTGEEKTILSDILLDMEDAPEDELVRLDQAFHITLIRATKNPLFITIIEAIAEIYNESMSRVLTDSDDALKKEFLGLHQNIYRCITAGDKESCRKYLKEHYDLAERNL
jgi:GntR family transcriptional repressor for pyruvate dehydrogenase complex